MLAYTTLGNRNLPPLVFLHGFLGVKEDWNDVMIQLEQHFCCYAFDLPGHGESAYKNHLLEELFTSISSLKLLPAPLVGYSMGGRMALFLKEYFPEQFKELILLGAHPGLEKEVEKKFRWHQDLNWSNMLETGSFENFLHAWYSQPLFTSLQKRPELYQQLIKTRLQQNPKHFSDILRNFSLSMQPHLKKFHEKTLFLYGEEDAKFAHLYQTMLPKEVAVKKLPGGHILPLESPNAVAEEIRRFLCSPKK